MAKLNGDLFNVAIFLVDKAYGGPEEGGWWYTYGTRVTSIGELGADNVNPNDLLTVFDNEAEACSYRETLQLQLDAHVNKGRRDISSVLSEGVYNAMVHDGPAPPEHFPTERPHYE